MEFLLLITMAGALAWVWNRMDALERRVAGLEAGGFALDHYRPSEPAEFTRPLVPAAWHPLRPLMRWILRRFEPFALDLWAGEISAWLPAGGVAALSKRTYWGGLYQSLVVKRAPAAR